MFSQRNGLDWVRVQLAKFWRKKRIFTFLIIDGATLQQQKKTDPVLVLIIVEWMNNKLKNIFLYHQNTFFSSNHHFKNYYINTWIIIGMRLIWCVSLSDSFAAHRTSCRVIPLQKHDTAGHCKVKWCEVNVITWLNQTLVQSSYHIDWLPECKHKLCFDVSYFFGLVLVFCIVFVLF